MNLEFGGFKVLKFEIATEVFWNFEASGSFEA